MPRRSVTVEPPLLKKHLHYRYTVYIQENLHIILEIRKDNVKNFARNVYQHSRGRRYIV